MSSTIFIFFMSSFLLITYSHVASHVHDFCVADITGPQSPAGYSCKDISKVTVDDFVYTGLSVRSNTSNIFKFGFAAAAAPLLPGLNGLGVSIGRADLEIGGVVPIHSHPGANELVIIVEGSSIIGGFIDSKNTVYQKILKKGDVMVLPQGLYHFFVNNGKSPAVIYASFSSETPTVQTLDTLLFSNNLDTDIIANTTRLGRAQIRELKKLFHGTN
ncbi:hypothetical protein OROGR_004604 [Orobanche gracilis]